MSRRADWTSDAFDRSLAEDLARELPGLVAFARRMTADPHLADDVVQDTLERAWGARHQLRDADRLGPWLRKILVQRVYDRHRAGPGALVSPPEELEALLPDVQDVALILVATEDERIMRGALRSLSDLDRIALVLHDSEGWPASEVAELLEIGVDAAHKRIQRARSRLVTNLADAAGGAHDPQPGCRDARRQAHALLGTGYASSELDAVRAHLQSCPACPVALQAASAVLAELARARAQPVSAALSSRLSELVSSVAAEE